MNISSKNLKNRINVIAAFVIVLLVVVGTSAQTPDRVSKPARSAGGQNEGIKVHGHWLIEVRNPDGKLVTRREYENALHLQGKTVLANLLGRQSTTGLWRIHLNVDPTASPQISMYLVEPNDNRDFPSTPLQVSDSLQVATNNDKLVLSGSITAPQTGTIIGFVGTQVSTCGPTANPSTCAAYNFVRFSDKFLPSNIDIAPGQIVQVKVTISFS